MTNDNFPQAPRPPENLEQRYDDEYDWHPVWRWNMAALVLPFGVIAFVLGVMYFWTR